jgi:hypothetical protein
VADAEVVAAVAVSEVEVAVATSAGVEAVATSAALESQEILEESADAISAGAAILVALEIVALQAAMDAVEYQETPEKPSREGPDRPALREETLSPDRHRQRTLCPPTPAAFTIRTTAHGITAIGTTIGYTLGTSGPSAGSVLVLSLEQ